MKKKNQAKMKSGNAGMEKLIPAMNKILDVCSQIGVKMEFDFPLIAVIGCQSAGKSSVLENFVGRDFLPRGSDIVTRCPLILQLIQAPKEYGVFMHCKDEEFTDFNEIRNEIERETERRAGKNKGVSSDAINLHIHSPHVLNLTLIDLPGMTKVAIGDQPADIEHQIRDMILDFITKENCLILAVSPANSDLANSDALKIAKEVDPQGDRTIGVITKLDLMDEGTDARDILENKKLPLRRKYVGIVNRSQQDINVNKDISAAKEAEREFFMKHKSYSHMADRMGTHHLQNMLNQELTEHIRCKLPGLRDKLSKDMTSLEKEIEEFNILHKTDPDDMKEMMLTLIQKVQSDFKKETGGLGLKDLRTDGLSHGAIICEIFHERFSREISEITFHASDVHKKIHFGIRNTYVYLSGEFEPYNVFECFVRQQIDRFERPVCKCIDSVMDELISVVRIATQQVSSYPILRDAIERKIISFIRNNGPQYKKSILSLIKMEHAYVNTKNKEFKNIPTEIGDTDSSLVRIPYNEDEPEEKSNDIAVDMCKKIDFYITKIVKKNICDMVPKAITLYIINELEKFMDKKLLLDFGFGLTNDEYLKIFTLAPEVHEKHKAQLKIYEATKAALDIIDSVSV